MLVRKYSTLILVFTMLLSLVTEDGYAQQPPPTKEYYLKAEWMHQFAKNLVAWEEETDDPFVIGVFGDYPGDLRRHLRNVGNRRLGERQIRIEQYRTLANFNANRKPDILFISSRTTNNETFAQRVTKAREIIGDRPVLLVGDTKDEEQRMHVSFFNDRTKKLLMLHLNESAFPDGLHLRNETVWEDLPNLERVPEQNTGNRTPGS